MRHLTGGRPYDDAMSSRWCGRVRAFLVTALAAAAIVVFEPTRPTVAAAEAPSYQAIVPQRVLDSRFALGTANAAKSTPHVPVPVRLPAVVTGAAAVALNVTVTQPSADGFATAYPCGQDPPDASNVNFLAGQTVPNLVIAKPGAGGQVCIVTSVAAHLVADLEGWFPPGSYDPLATPTRTLDTRTGAGRKLLAGVETHILDDNSAGAVAANVTVTEPDGRGFMTVYPCGTTPPVASNLNFAAGGVVANLVIEQSGPSGGVCAVSTTSTHLVVDIQGHLAPGAAYTSIPPMRIADTRSALGVPVTAPVLPHQTTELSFPVLSGIPAVVDTVVVNVTATDSDASGYLTVFPCGEPTAASNLNIVAGDTRANLVITRVGAGGTICVTGDVSTNVVVDLQGWFRGPAPLPAISAPARQHVDVNPDLAMGYLAYLPAGYASSAGRTWPTMVFLHGSGQAGTGSGASLDSVAVTGLPRLYEAGIEPAVAAGFVVLVPQIPDKSHWPPRLHQWLGEVLARYAVDRDRIYLTGLSLGGYGVFDYIGAYGDSNEFAAMVAIAGDYTKPIQCANWRHTPLWVFHGEADPNVPIAGAIRTVSAVNAQCEPGERVRLTTYPGVGHNSYDMTYDLSGMAPGQTNPSRDPYDIDIYTWMLAHQRSRER
ncbi:MAG: hypothetical protein QOD72_1826 [Acidimicrobiaceae bacterium]|nr:hypothetical protein [Acidimicrobiaceae bacterium]